MRNKTMHEAYGEPNNGLGKHKVCKECGCCIDCGDCKEHHDKILKMSERIQMGNKFICKVCGKEEKNQLDLDVWHRGCRLGQFFQRDKKLEKEMGVEGTGLMVLDITKGKGKKGKELVKELNKVSEKNRNGKNEKTKNIRNN